MAGLPGQRLLLLKLCSKICNQTWPEEWGAGVKQGGTVRGIGLLGPHLGQGQAGWLGKGPMGISLTVARGWEGI